ncbi:TetR/AcrR family transcriptional regulator [Burkholderia cenocepacia]|nr:TetR/AcrR family transcriptional regulator [Burkholderia cenocepacia]RQU57001.1 TetR/AcrR family transcriptional regulator [Burkholderia cenocepacia]
MTHSGKRRRVNRDGAASGVAAPLASGDSHRDALRPRKLPRQIRAIATVDAILDAASDILEREGFDGYSTNAIADRAGTSIGSLYQYFPNKIALTRALIAREDAALLSSLAQLSGRGAGIDTLRELIQISVEHQLRRPALTRLLSLERSRLPVTHETQQLSDVLASIFRCCLGDDQMALEPRLPQDLSSIIRGMADAAGMSGEVVNDALAIRVERAVFGYIAILIGSC